MKLGKEKAAASGPVLKEMAARELEEESWAAWPCRPEDLLLCRRYILTQSDEDVAFLFCAYSDPDSFFTLHPVHLIER